MVMAREHFADVEEDFVDRIVGYYDCCGYDDEAPPENLSARDGLMKDDNA